MIEELLKVQYPNRFGIDVDRISVSITTRSGLIELSDAKACTDCVRLRPERNLCDRINMKLNTSDSRIYVVDFEGYISQFDKTTAKIKDRCDYIIADDMTCHNKIAFCDLTCSAEKYVNSYHGKYPLGKRAKAKSQMEKSIESLLKEELLANYILTYPNRVCLFGWRDYNVPDNATPQRGDALRNMQAFMMTPSSRSKLLSVDVTVHGFTFVQVKYPAVYQW